MESTRIIAPTQHSIEFFSHFLDKSRSYFHEENVCCPAILLNAVPKKPILLFITIAVVIGSSCLLSGLFLLFLVSRTLQDEVSEAILLLGIGFFIASLAAVAWKLTTKQQLSSFLKQLKEEIV